MKWFALLVACFWAGPLMAQSGIEFDDIRLELVPEELDHAPLPGEMILLSIRGTYKIPVVRETLQQPSLEGFDWMQLGEDRWYKEREDGFEVLKFERRMALFPQRAGQIAVPPFTHQLEMLARNGQTLATKRDSNSLTIDVAPLEHSPGWWFPVRDIDVSDRWSNQPETLEAGAAALRIVSLRVEGSAPHRIPPMPELSGAGAHIFPHPEQRIVALGPSGPITRVFWRWTVRPMEGSAGYLNPIPFSYFDSSEREMREITLSAQRVAYLDGPQDLVSGSSVEPAAGALKSDNRTWQPPHIPDWAVPVSALVGLFSGIIALFFTWKSAGLQLPIWHRRDPTTVALRRAVRRKDANGVWRHATSILGKKDAEPPQVLLDLERALFDKDGTLPDLRMVRSAVSAGAPPADQAS